MPNSGEKQLSLIDAACLIYHTRNPTKEQIKRVYIRMKSGILPVHDYGREPLEWMTTEGALADYLAAQLLKPRRKPTPVRPQRDRASQQETAVRSGRRNRDATELRSVYRGMLRDYFLAVMLRRRMGSRSVAFRRAVLAGQIVLLAGFVVWLLAMVRIASVPLVPEHVAIQQWINEATDRYEVLRWYPTASPKDGRGVIVEVEYKYAKDSPRTVLTRRLFRVVDGIVEEMSTD